MQRRDFLGGLIAFPFIPKIELPVSSDRLLPPEPGPVLHAPEGYLSEKPGTAWGEGSWVTSNYLIDSLPGPIQVYRVDAWPQPSPLHNTSPIPWSVLTIHCFDNGAAVTVKALEKPYLRAIVGTRSNFIYYAPRAVDTDALLLLMQPGQLMQPPEYEPFTSDVPVSKYSPANCGFETMVYFSFR